MNGIIKKTLARLLCISVLFGTLFSALTSCGGKDELGNRYKNKTEDKAAASSLVTEAAAESDKLSDISYKISLMVYSDYGGKSYTLGIENLYNAKGRNTDRAEISCSKTFYGTEGSESDKYYRHDGHIYIDYCNTLIRSPMSEADFYKYVVERSNTASTDFFKPSSFGEGCVYTYKDGSRSSVFTAPNAELTEKIAEFLGLSPDVYTYAFSNTVLRCNVTPNGTVSKCVLSFDTEYYKTSSPDGKINYRGEFVCEVSSVGANVSVDIPSDGDKYSTVSDFAKLKLLTESYDKLVSYTELSVDYERKVSNEDLTGAVYQVDSKVSFTQSYKDKVYTYGSIDVEKSKTPQIEDEVFSSVGDFITPDGVYYHKDLTDESKNAKEENSEATAEERLTFFAATISGERFWEDQITDVTVSEDSEYITFTYKYGSDYYDDYATYLLEAFAQAGSLSVSGQHISIMRNTGTVKVRLSDGCLVYHSVGFEAIIGYSIKVSGDFSLTVNATGDDVRVLDLTDWQKHVMSYN